VDPVSARQTWTVVSHTADDSIPAVSVTHLMAWLDRHPEVDLHTVLWSRGHRGTAPYDFGRLANVGDAHEAFLAQLLRRMKLGRVAGGVAGRAVRATLRSVPTEGVLYLSSAASGPVLRYLSPGDRTVVTHLHAMDRQAKLSPEKLAALRDATHVWLAVDDETRDWAVTTLGLDPLEVNVVPEPIDGRSWNRAMRAPEPDVLRLGVRGAAWFRTDHTARLVQRLRRLRPDLRIEMVLAEAIADREHMTPLLYDLEMLGVVDLLEMPRSSDEVIASLDDIDLMVLTTPDDEGPWSVHEALNRGVPMVCFDTHRLAGTIGDTLGYVVPYLDIVAMADRVLALHSRDPVGDSPEIVRKRAEMWTRDVETVGARIMELAGSVRR
jgi:glycosyltransferase involved in cell wall biosynthesis